MIFLFGCGNIGLGKFLKDLAQARRNEKKKTEYKLIIDSKEYKNTECTINLNGERFGIFERRSGLLRMDRIKIVLEDLKINHKTGICHLKVKA